MSENNPDTIRRLAEHMPGSINDPAKVAADMAVALENSGLSLTSGDDYRWRLVSSTDEDGKLVASLEIGTEISEMPIPTTYKMKTIGEALVKIGTQFMRSRAVDDDEDYDDEEDY